MYIISTFTEAGTPKTGLSPTGDIYDVSDNSLVVNDGAFIEIGEGGYKYDFTLWDSAKDYYVVIDSVALTGSERYAFTTISGSRVIEGTLSEDDVLRLLLSKEMLKASGGGTTEIKFRNLADDKDRIVLVVNSNGNRSGFALDGT